MSSSAFAATLDIRPGRSNLLGGFLLLTHLLAGAALTAWIPQIPLLLLLLALLLGSLLWSWRRHLQPVGMHRITRLMWQSSGKWQLFFGSAEVPVAAELLPGTFVHPMVILLCLRCQCDGRYRRFSLVLCRDALDAATHRRLRARLRMHGSAASLPEGNLSPSGR